MQKRRLRAWIALAQRPVRQHLQDLVRRVVAEVKMRWQPQTRTGQSNAGQHMFLEQRQVSPKTQFDGRLEVSADTATRLGALGSALVVVARGERRGARVESMTCTCAKRSGEPHVHHFVTSPLLKTLAAESQVRLELEAGSATLRIEPIRD